MAQLSNIDEIGVSFVQLAFQKMGFIFREQTKSDYGIDAHVEVVKDGRATGRLLAIQIKSGMSFFRETNKMGTVYRGDNKHLHYWFDHSLPVIIVLYHPDNDTAYWQIISNSTTTRTENGWKITVTFNQQINKDSKDILEKLARPVGKPTILKFSDENHGLAKRYSANILLPNTFNRSEIIQSVLSVNNEFRGRSYYRNSITEQYWSHSPAHIIFLYLYFALEDVGVTNWICQCVWMDNEYLDEATVNHFSQFFTASSSECLEDGTIVRWSTDYEVRKELHDQAQLTKEEYLYQIQPIVLPVISLINKAVELTANYMNGTLDSGSYEEQMTELEPHVSDLYMKSIRINGVPFECRDVHNRLQTFIAVCHNIVLPFSDIGQGKWEEHNRKFLLKAQIERYQQEFVRLEFELEKVQ